MVRIGATGPDQNSRTSLDVAENLIKIEMMNNFLEQNFVGLIRLQEIDWLLLMFFQLRVVGQRVYDRKRVDTTNRIV